MTEQLIFDISNERTIPDFIFDVKILYQLAGMKVETLEGLAVRVLGQHACEGLRLAMERFNAHVRSFPLVGLANVPEAKRIPPEVILEITVEREKLTRELWNIFANPDVLHFYPHFFPHVANLHAIAKNLGLHFNFVTKNGRLSFKPGTLNPYLMTKESRKSIKAGENCRIVQFDWRSCQPRLAFQFAGYGPDLPWDIYSLFPGDREKNKQGFIRWMFSPQFANDDVFGKIGKPIKDLRKRLFENAMDGVLKNPNGRPLFLRNAAEHLVFQNWIASSEADLLFELVSGIHKSILAGKRSQILFPFHDAIVAEIHDDEREEMIQKIHSVMAVVCPVGISIGENFGEMKPYAI